MFSRWVNTLGMAAVQGIDVVLRHSFFDYGYTHLVDQNFNPLPVSLSNSVTVSEDFNSYRFTLLRPQLFIIIIRI